MGSVALPVLATHDTTAPTSTPSERDATLADRNDIRASKLMGSSVYNDHDEKVGSVDDVVLGQDNKAANVILSGGGFLGMGTKLVAVPCQQLQLGDTKHASSDNKVVIPGATKESLKALPDFDYSVRT
jgi:sporulation protein YlmC with PRC-barrel domain